MRADIDDIMRLRELHYIWTKVAALLNISRATLYRRLIEAGISPHDYTPLSERQLDAVICSIKQYHPNDGEVLMRGHLLSQGIRVSHRAVRAAIHSVDHVNVIARRRSVVRRRVYSVPHPNYLWHVDGHHKLIRWCLVIHAAIDGFSHTVTYNVQITIVQAQCLLFSVVVLQDLACLTMFALTMEVRNWGMEIYDCSTW